MSYRHIIDVYHQCAPCIIQIFTNQLKTEVIKKSISYLKWLLFFNLSLIGPIFFRFLGPDFSERKIVKSTVMSILSSLTLRCTFSMGAIAPSTRIIGSCASHNPTERCKTPPTPPISNTLRLKASPGPQAVTRSWPSDPSPVSVFSPRYIPDLM